MTYPQDSQTNQQQPADGAGNEPITDWFSQSETLQALAQLVRDGNLAELEMSRGTRRIVLKTADTTASTPRLSEYPPAVYPPAAFPGVEAAGIQDIYDLPHTDAADVTDAPVVPAQDANLVTVVSPMVGIFYRAPSPNDPDFVEVGAHVEVGQTLCLVETMKVFNEITSEWDGSVVEILAENSQLLETGDRLMVIRKS